MIREIKEEAERRGITRLCHFTPSRNLVHIASGKTGILATAHLAGDERSVFTPTDLERLDGHVGFISCSIEYPNAWYFDKARQTDVLFRDWVVLLIDPRYLWLEGTRFCSRNAAAGYGRYVGEGPKAFCNMFAASVEGAGGKTRCRTRERLACCPTDDQAEVLVPDGIALGDIVGVVVTSETQAKAEASRMRLAGGPVDAMRMRIGPVLFNKYDLSNHLRCGQRPVEVVWPPGGSKDA